MLDSKLTRRTFLQAAAVTGAGLTILGATDASLKVARGKEPDVTYEWMPNICTMCVNTCGIKVKVRKTGNTTRAVKIEGNPDSPYNRGKICARGQAGLRRVYDPQRITQPLIRIDGSKRGEWKFKPATWEEAYNYIGMKMQQEKIMPYEIAASGGWISCAFYRPYLLGFAFAMEIPNILATPMQHCVMSEHLALDAAIGTFNVHDEVVADYDKARYYLSMGANAAVAAIATGRAVRFAEGKRNGMKVVVVDPRMSELAAKADEWVPIKPGTDVAFALAMMHTIVQKGLYDEEFVRKHSNLPFLVMEMNGMIMPAMDEGGPMGMPKGFYVYDELSKSVRQVAGFPANHNYVDAQGNRIMPALTVPAGTTWNGKPVKALWQYLLQNAAQYTPQWASKICDVPAETIERIATEFGSTRPALMEPGWHDSRYGSTPQFRKVTALIQGLVGGIDREGGWVFVGGSRETMKNFLEIVGSGQMPKSPLQLPGLFSPKAALDMRFNNPTAWSHGHPSVNQAWNENEWQNGRPGVGFNLYTDVGYEEAITGKLQYKGQPYKIRAMFLSQTNLVRNFIGWKELFTHPDMKLVVAIEIGPSDSLPYADVILPDTAYLEKYDPLFEVGMSHDIGLTTRVPSIPAPGQVKHTVDMFAEMAMGFKVDLLQQLAGIFVWDEPAVKQFVGQAMQSGKGATYGIQQYQLAALAKQLNTTPEKIMATIREKGVFPIEKREELLAKMGMPYQLPLSTPSGRFEFYSLFMANLLQTTKSYSPNVDPFFSFVPTEWKKGMKPEERLTADDEFFFIYGKVPTQSHAATMNNDLLTAVSEIHRHEYYGVWIHPDRAGRLGIKTGDRINLTNTLSGQTSSGSAYVTEKIRPDTVFIAAAFGGENPEMKNSYGKGTALSSLVSRRAEPLVGGLKASEFTVKVAKA
ncbi:MAG: molybdopterin-dependent oxidoreductase [Mycobacterium leprae]